MTTTSPFSGTGPPRFRDLGGAGLVAIVLFPLAMGIGGLFPDLPRDLRGVDPTPAILWSGLVWTAWTVIAVGLSADELLRAEDLRLLATWPLTSGRLFARKAARFVPWSRPPALVLLAAAAAALAGAGLGSGFPTAVWSLLPVALGALLVASHATAALLALWPAGRRLAAWGTLPLLAAAWLSLGDDSRWLVGLEPAILRDRLVDSAPFRLLPTSWTLRALVSDSPVPDLALAVVGAIAWGLAASVGVRASLPRRYRWSDLVDELDRRRGDSEGPSDEQGPRYPLEARLENLVSVRFLTVLGATTGDRRPLLFPDRLWRLALLGVVVALVVRLLGPPGGSLLRGGLLLLVALASLIGVGAVQGLGDAGWGLERGPSTTPLPFLWPISEREHATALLLATAGSVLPLLAFGLPVAASFGLGAFGLAASVVTVGWLAGASVLIQLAGPRRVSRARRWLRIGIVLILLLVLLALVGVGLALGRELSPEASTTTRSWLLLGLAALAGPPFFQAGRSWLRWTSSRHRFDRKADPGPLG